MSEMFGGIPTILLPIGLLFAAAGLAYALTVSGAGDPKLKLLDSLLRSAGEEATDSRRGHAA